MCVTDATFFAVKIVAVFKNCREHRFDVSHRIVAIQEKKTVTGNKNPLILGLKMFNSYRLKIREIVF